jgi:hypothetical protein
VLEAVEAGFDRRDDLAAGVFHQHDGWDADVFDRPAIRLAHLSRIKQAHGKD